MKWGYLNTVLQRITIKKSCLGYYLRWYYNGFHYWNFLSGRESLLTEGENYRTIGTRKISMGTGQVTAEQVEALRTIMNTREVSIYTDTGWKSIRIEPGSLIVNTNIIDGYEFDFIAIIGSREISVTGYSPAVDVPIIPPEPDPDICEVIVGTQIWMCKNYEGNFPGSKVYNDNEANRTIYGGLYTFDMVKNPGFCPTGWHVPTLAEWLTLVNFLGGAAVAGDKLKAAGTIVWNAGNAGDNSSGLAFPGSGYRYPFNVFYGLKQISIVLTQTDNIDWPALYFEGVVMDYNLGSVEINNAFSYQWKSMYYPVRLIKDSILIIYTCDSTVLKSDTTLITSDNG